MHSDPVRALIAAAGPQPLWYMICNVLDVSKLHAGALARWWRAIAKDDDALEAETFTNGLSWRHEG